MLNLKKTEAEKIKNEGNELAAKQQYAAAIEKYQQALAIAPTLESAWLNLGLMQKKLTNFPAAKIAFESALKLNEHYLKARVNLADTLINLDDAERAEDIVRELLNSYPNNAEVMLVQQRLKNSMKNKKHPDDEISRLNPKPIIVPQYPNAPQTPYAAARPVMPKRSMVDLHGDSVEIARDRVRKEISTAQFNQRTKIRFVTGRGNHINAQGNRGTLHQEFENWIADLKDEIESVEKHEGYYEVNFKLASITKLQYQIEEMAKKTLAASLPKIKIAAEAGEAFEQMLMGSLYAEGLGVPQDDKLSAEWMLKAAEQKLAEAEYQMGGCYLIGKGVKQSDTIAIEWFKRAADKHHSIAMKQLGDMYFSGIGTPINDEEALKWHTRVADLKGNDLWVIEAARKAGSAHYWGHGTPINYQQAFNYYKQAADSTPGDSTAQYNLGGMLLEGKGVVKKDEAKAFDYFSRAADQNDGDAYHLLSYFYTHGIIVKKDLAKVLEHEKKGAALNSADAAFGLFANTQLTLEERFNYLRQAADLGNPSALVLVAYLPQPTLSEEERSQYMTKVMALSEEVILHNISFPAAKYQIAGNLFRLDSTKKQQKKGFRLANKLIELNDSQGHQLLGEYYYARKNYALAKQQWELGGEKGNATCNCSLGYYYEDEVTGEINLTKAFAYYKKSAKAGNANGDNQLGQFYFEGKGGIEKNGQQAKFHFEHAIKIEKELIAKNPLNSCFIHRSMEFALFNLGRLYLSGCTNLESNEELGIKTLAEATEKGHPQAPFILARYFLHIKQDLQQSIHWLKQAAAMNNEEAIQMLDKLKTVETTGVEHKRFSPL